ncbi:MULTISPECIES: pyridoxal phosphate-dependent aminotransferase [unclassified Streptomyces]|uniref:pyridoxal phosphate-dependent aminotransferase n=1 Tax=unclassified Streptomyces TaxID=2593676 RepID=UPI0038054141
MSGVTFSNNLLESKALVLTDPDGLDRTACLRLDRNENTSPLPPPVTAAISGYVNGEGCQWYPSDRPYAADVAAYAGVPEASVLLTNGSDQGIDITLRAFLGGGGTLLTAVPEFLPFRRISGILGARIAGIPYTEDFTFPYAEFRTAAAAERPELIVFTNPNNPTGTPIDEEFIEEVLGLYREVPVIVDEAYHEFAGRTVAHLVGRYPNLIVLRTFSKAFAMAGLRLGYLLAHPDVVEQLGKLRNPFDVNQLALVAARAHLADPEAMREHVRETMTKVKPEVVGFFGDLGVPVVDGAANFLLVRPADLDTTVRRLRDAHVLVQPLHAPLVAGMFRLTLGSAEEMRRFMSVYGEIHREG